jgi:hypothetical protein
MTEFSSLEDWSANVLALTADSISFIPGLEAVEFEDSEDGIRSEFIKTPCGTRHIPLWDLTKTGEKSKCMVDQSIFTFNLAILKMLCMNRKTQNLTFIH